MWTIKSIIVEKKFTHKEKNAWLGKSADIFTCENVELQVLVLQMAAVHCRRNNEAHRELT